MNITFHQIFTFYLSVINFGFLYQNLKKKIETLDSDLKINAATKIATSYFMSLQVFFRYVKQSLFSNY